MPYTLVHPVAALPIYAATQHRLRLAALAIGAMMPDFQYFLVMNTQGRFMHTPLGWFVACLPVGWLTLILWDRYGWAGLAALLPREWRNDLPSPPRYQVVGISLAILAGVVSHVVWDGFTHASGMVVTQFPDMYNQVQIGYKTWPVYKWLQHGSTLAGGAFLCFLAVRWMAARPRVPFTAIVSRALTAGLFLGALAALNVFRFLGHSKERLAVTAAVAITLGVVFGPIVIGLVLSGRDKTEGYGPRLSA